MKHRLKKAAAIFLALVLALGLCPMHVSAQGCGVTLDGTPYDSLAQALAAVEDGAEATISLSEGEHSFDGYEIADGKKITIVGAGEASTTITTSNVCAFHLAGDGASLTLRDLTVSSTATSARVIRLVDGNNMSFAASRVTLATPAGSSGNVGIYTNGSWKNTAQPTREGLVITLDDVTYRADNALTGLYFQNSTGIDLQMDNCDFLANMYAVYLQQDTVATVQITSSLLEGWAAFYTFSLNSTININNSTLIGVNRQPYVENQKNDFSTIAVDGGGLNGLEAGRAGCGNTLTISDSTIKASTTGGRYQNILGSSYLATKNLVNFNNCQFEVSGVLHADLGGGALPPVYSMDDIENQITVNGLTLDVSSSGNPNLIPVAKVRSTGYSTLSAAFATAQDKDTVTLLENVSTASVSVVGKELLLDLNGHTITGSENSLFRIGNGTAGSGKLTVTNSTTLPGGVTTSHNRIFQLYGGELVLQKGTFTQRGHDTTIIDLFGDSDTNAQRFSVLTIDKGVVVQAADGATGVYAVNIFNESGGNSVQPASGVVIDIAGEITDVALAMYLHGNITSVTGYVPQITVRDTARLEADFGIYAAGYGEWSLTGGSVSGSTGVEIRGGKLSVSGSAVITGTAVPTSVLPNGSGTTTDGAGIGIAQHTTKLPLEVDISGGTISGYTALYQSNPQANDDESVNKVKISVTDGRFSCVNGGSNVVYSENKTGFLKGGHFTSDPTAYVAPGYVVIAGSETGYAYTVQEKADDEVIVKPAAKDPVVESTIEDPDEKAVAEAVASTVDAPSIVDAAGKTNITDADKDAAVSKAQQELGTSEDMIIYTQAYLEIRPSAYSETEKKLVMDISPKMQLVVSTAATAGEITDSNAVSYGKPRDLTITSPTVITLQLPAGFASEGETVYIQHEASDGNIYFYTAVMESDNIISFTSFHGFSPFAFSLVNEAVAEIGSIGYPTLQAAVDAVRNGETIKLLADNSESATVSRTVSFTLNSAGFSFSGEIVSGSLTTASSTNGDGGKYSFTRRESSGGTIVTPFPFSDVPTDSWYYGAIKYVYERGMMNGTDNTLFSPESPTTRGMIVTILHRLENSPTSLKSSFADVADSQYCYSAVAWACENGIVNGYGDGRFGPDDNITREQLATVLYRYACWKGLDVSADEAGDILSYQDADNISDYALEAVQWAYDTGLLQGRSQNELQPAASATRGEIAVILQRFATLGQ